MRRSQKNRSIQSRLTKRGVLITALVMVAVLAAGLWYWNSRPAKTNPSANTSTTSKPTNTIDYSPAKPSDNTAANQNKGSAPASSTPSSNPSPASGAAITITGANPQSASQSIEVSALVEGVTSGTCTFSFSRSAGGTAVKTYSEAVVLATNYYTCPRHAVPMPGTGDWYISAVLTSGSQSANSTWAANPVRL